MTKASLRSILRYGLYDAGNSNYVTLVFAVAFPLYFTTAIAPAGASTDLVWSLLVVISTLLAAGLGPGIGQWADRSGSKFRLLRWISIAAIAGSASLPLLRGRGMLLAGTVFIATETFYQLAVFLYDAALSDVSSRENAAEISSMAWGIGYAGGLVGLLCGVVLAGPQSGGGPSPARLEGMFILAAGLYLVLGLPLMVKRDPAAGRRAADPPAAGAVGGASLARRESFLAPVRRFLKDRTRTRLLIAFFCYSNGVSAVITFTSLYAQKTLAYSLQEILWLFVAMNAVAAPASLVFGKVAARFGHLPTLKGVVAAWMAAVVAVSLAGPATFAPIACVAAALLGPVQALSRSLFRILFPEDSMTSFFGVQAIATRGSALVGPLFFGVASHLTGSQRIGALTAAGLFACGLILLAFVPKAEVEAAEAE